MRVIGDKVLVEVLPREDVVNPHGIHLPESKSTPVLYGMVLAHGAEVGGVFAGDRLYFHARHGLEVERDGGTYRVLPASEIGLILDDDE